MAIYKGVHFFHFFSVIAYLPSLCDFKGTNRPQTSMQKIYFQNLFFELVSKSILHVLHAGVSWPNHVHYPLHAPKLRLSEPVLTVALSCMVLL